MQRQDRFARCGRASGPAGRADRCGKPVRRGLVGPAGPVPVPGGATADGSRGGIWWRRGKIACLEKACGAAHFESFGGVAGADTREAVGLHAERFSASLRESPGRPTRDQGESITHGRAEGLPRWKDSQPCRSNYFNGS